MKINPSTHVYLQIGKGKYFFTNWPTPKMQAESASEK